MNDAGSLLEKAERFRAEVRRIDEGASAEQAARSATQRIQELRSALADLTAQVSLARALARCSGVPLPLGDVHSGLDELRRKASTGLPADQAFNTARKKVRAATEDLAQRAQQTWRTWTASAVDSLPLNRMAGLDRAKQRAVQAALTELNVLRKRSTPSATDVNEFSGKHGTVLDHLAAAADAPEELLALLARFDSRVLTLRDITDSDIALLREHGMDGGIEIRRVQG
ncbi:hypothetical protein L6E12_16500 [Actinokineospora sp. PR83]|uniref:hypothetical protein n=1 Tax=Actinokineospora sp. PR83 TaxID=2884908 RepID=UPI001F45F183|nr:hypothetical protein [Actinokineospora sp. PR83]MCG8917387.1 hypothetical protein [Actinokineospora sp. PR83]